MQVKTKNRITILLTALLFMAPVVVAYLLSSGIINYHPEQTKNNGVFISPVVKMTEFSGEAWSKELLGHWTLIRRVPEVCVNKCQALEDELNRYRLSLGHRAEKLNLMLIADGYNSEMPDKFPHIKKVSLTANSALHAIFRDLSERSLKSGHGLYVVAPEGYLMMAFTAENSSTDIIRDLSLLVKRKGD